MKKRKSLVQKVLCLWNSSQIHGRGHLLSNINGKGNICECPVNRVKVVFNRTRPYKTVLGTVRQLCKNCLQIVFKPWQTLLYRVYPYFIRAYSCYIRVSLVSWYGWNPILVPVNPCITEYTVWEPCTQPCFVWGRLKSESASKLQNYFLNFR